MRAWLSETDLSLMLNSLLSTKERFLLVYCCSRPCLFVQRFNTFTTHCRWPAFMLARCAKYKNRARNGLLTVHFFTDLPDEVCHLSLLLCERTKESNTCPITDMPYEKMQALQACVKESSKEPLRYDRRKHFSNLACNTMQHMHIKFNQLFLHLKTVYGIEKRCSCSENLFFLKRMFKKLFGADHDADHGALPMVPTQMLMIRAL